MTEDEAKTKWCPFTRFSGSIEDDIICNRDSFLTRTSLNPSDEPDHCIASACMAWRWRAVSEKTDDATWYRIGFCGLAGPPYD